MGPGSVTSSSLPHWRLTDRVDEVSGTPDAMGCVDGIGCNGMARNSMGWDGRRALSSNVKPRASIKLARIARVARVGGWMMTDDWIGQ